VFDVDGVKGLTLVEIAEGVSLEDIRAATGCQFEVHRERFVIPAKEHRERDLQKNFEN